MRQFTDTEIKMAEKAEEIQKNHPLYTEIPMIWVKEQQPYRFCPNCDRAIDTAFCPDCGSKMEQTKQGTQLVFTRHANSFFTGVWLPLEHQLWGMLYIKLRSKGYVALRCFNDWLIKGGVDNSQIELTSMWQLLLAFVMHELYGKVWDSDKEEWVKE